MGGREESEATRQKEFEQWFKCSGTYQYLSGGCFKFQVQRLWAHLPGYDCSVVSLVTTVTVPKWGCRVPLAWSAWPQDILKERKKDRKQIQNLGLRVSWVFFCLKKYRILCRFWHARFASSPICTSSLSACLTRS